MFCGVINTQGNFYSPKTAFKSSVNSTNMLLYKGDSPDICTLRGENAEKNADKLSPKQDEMLKFINSLDYHQFHIEKSADLLKNQENVPKDHSYTINVEELVDSSGISSDGIVGPYRNKIEVEKGFHTALNDEKQNKYKGTATYKKLIVKTLIALNYLDEFKLEGYTKDEKFNFLVPHLANAFFLLSENYKKISQDYSEGSKLRILAENKAETAHDYNIILLEDLADIVPLTPDTPMDIKMQPAGKPKKYRNIKSKRVCNDKNLKK